jgi:hypothetical protein
MMSTLRTIHHGLKPWPKSGAWPLAKAGATSTVVVLRQMTRPRRGLWICWLGGRAALAGIGNNRTTEAR